MPKDKCSPTYKKVVNSATLLDQDLATRMRQARKDCGLSQEEMGEKMRMPQTVVSAIERMVRGVSLPTLVAWAEATGTTPNDLLAWGTPPCR